MSERHQREDFYRLCVFSVQGRFANRPYYAFPSLIESGMLPVFAPLRNAFTVDRPKKT